MSNLQWSSSTATLKECIIDGTVIAVSDGLHFERYDIKNCGRIIATPDEKRWIIGGGTVPGTS